MRPPPDTGDPASRPRRPRRLRRAALLAAALAIDGVVLGLLVTFGGPFLGDRGEFHRFAVDLQRLHLAIWIGGRITAAALSGRRSRPGLGYRLTLIGSVLLFGVQSIVSWAGAVSRGVGEFPGWKGWSSLPILVGRLLDPQWRPFWQARFDPSGLLLDVLYFGGLFLLAARCTRLALSPPRPLAEPPPRR